MDKVMRVFSENPEEDLWRDLLQFTYAENIQRFLNSNGHTDFNDETVDCISGSFLQAYEYYKSAKNANLQISPLLLYYGTTNLLYGMSNLLDGKINNINNHGMKIYIPEQFKFISKIDIRFFSPNDGGVHVIAKALGYNENLTTFGDWKLSEFLDSIAEINDDYKQCYSVTCGKIAMLDVYNTPDGKIEKIYFDEKNKDEILELLNQVEDIRQSYLNINSAKNTLTNTEYFVLRHKINGEDISEISYSGQPYLRASQEKKNKRITIPTIINMYVSLFALSSLCRYHPQYWSPFVLKDTTGEKLLIEKLLYYARLIIPNIVIDKILGYNKIYTSNKYQSIDTIKFVGEHQVQEMIKKEFKIQSEKDCFKRQI